MAIRKTQRKKIKKRFHVSRQDYRNNIRRQTERARYRMRKSLLFVVLGVLIMSIAITYMFYGIAVRDHRMYSEMAANTHTLKRTIYPARGNIYSADGKSLAISTFTYTVGITPSVFGPRSSSEWTDAEAEEEFARILDIDLYQFRENLKRYEDSSYITIKQNINAEKNDELQEFLSEAAISGVRSDANQSRYYPQGDLASTIVGFASKRDDNITGVLGVESYYNQTLSGSEGFLYAQVDNFWGQALPDSAQVDVEAQDGNDLYLTIESDLQRIAQDQARKMVEVSSPLNGGQIIVMEVQTGNILAMTGDNNFNLNTPMEAPYFEDPEHWNPEESSEQLEYITGTYWSNRATNYPYEVGSVFKPFVVGMGFDEDVITPDATVSDDFVYIDGWNQAISSYDDKSKGDISLSYAIWDSRNPPFVRLAQSLGIPTFYEYINRLGIRQTTGIDLPNEQKGIVHEDPQEIDMAVTAFGEQFTITALQLINDYQMLANGGTMLRPNLVSEVRSSMGDVVSLREAEVVREVYSRESTKKIMDILIGVGRYGTGRELNILGLETAIKTGTSSRALNGSLYDNYYTHTAAMILPAENPRYVLLSTLHDIEEMRSRSQQVALRNVAQYLVERENMPLQYKAYDYNKLFATRYGVKTIDLDLQEGQKLIYNYGGDFVTDDSLAKGDVIKSQYPIPGYYVGHDPIFWLSGEEGAYPEEHVILPDFTGLTVEEARNLAKRYRLNLAFTGENRAGVVTSQNVLHSEIAGGEEPGDNVRVYTQIILHFDGTDARGPREDDSLVYGMDNGTGYLHGYSY